MTNPSDDPRTSNASSGDDIVSMVTDYSENRSEASMSMNTAMTGEKVMIGGQPSIKKVKPKVSIDEYDVGKTVGQGAYGKVMLASEKSSGKEVAIKAVS